MQQGPGTGMGSTPGSMLEIYMAVLENSTPDEFLDSINLGVGFYSDSEYWQQVKSFRHGMYASSAMTRKVTERAKRQTQKRIVDAIFDEDDRDAEILKGVAYPEPRDDEDKHEYLEAHMEDVWEDLGIDDEYTTTEHQAWLVHVCTGLDANWVPPHWRMLAARHEASRSKEARLMDDVFGRPPEPETMRPMEDFQ